MPICDLTLRLEYQDEAALREYIHQHTELSDDTPIEQLLRTFFIIDVDRNCHFTSADVPFSITGSRITPPEPLIRCGEDASPAEDEALTRTIELRRELEASHGDPEIIQRLYAHMQEHGIEWVPETLSYRRIQR